jgi:hypothetical protein
MQVKITSEAGNVGGLRHFVVFLGAAGLHDGGDAGLGGDFDAVGEGEKASEASTLPLARLPAFLHRRDARRLPAADADGLGVVLGASPLRAAGGEPRGALESAVKVLS